MVEISQIQIKILGRRNVFTNRNVEIQNCHSLLFTRGNGYLPDSLNPIPFITLQLSPNHHFTEIDKSLREDQTKSKSKIEELEIQQINKQSVHRRV